MWLKQKMTLNKLTKWFALILSITVIIPCFAQEPEVFDPDLLPKRKSKFITGFYLGSYFANKYSASTYNGYGFDIDGKQNTFATSFMYQKIKNEYGGGYGQTDQIAEALGVDRGQWEFNESDMPINMRYLAAIMLGVNIKVPIDKRSFFLFNLNGSRLNLGGNFTISTIRPPTSTNPAINSNIKTFPISGKEQRLLFELGFQRLFSKDEKFNVFGEFGLIGTLVKFDKNSININGLQIDLTYYVNQTANPAPLPTRPPVGFGIGAFGGLGVNIVMNQKTSLQFVYTLSHEKVNIGNNPKLKLQNGIGLRVYYNL
jgi:hypothetical protein